MSAAVGGDSGGGGDLASWTRCPTHSILPVVSGMSSLHDTLGVENTGFSGLQRVLEGHVAGLQRRGRSNRA